MQNTLSILKSISDRNRLRILSALLVHNELCACQITEFLDVAGATASRHLSQMVNTGVLLNRKQGRWVYFSINKQDTSIAPLFKWVRQSIKNSKQVKQDKQTLQKILRISCEELSRKQRDCGR